MAKKSKTPKRIAKKKIAKKKKSATKALSPKVALQKLGVMATAALQSSIIDEPTGRCMYTTSSGTHCAVLTKSWCVDELKGQWTEGAACP
jgi:hypothetical protein